MKHLITLFFAFTTCALFSSCDKAYTCHCTGAWTGEPVLVQIKAHDEKAAKIECSVKHREWNDGPQDCHLK
jgi:hypothetical protein